MNAVTSTSPSQTTAALPALQTARLVLRPFVLADAPRVKELAGAREIADTTSMPHPYPDGAAEAWIATHAQAFAEGKGLALAVALKNDLLIGCVSLNGISSQHQHAEIDYWIGNDYWGKGYCTEAAFEIVRFGFERLGLHRIFGHCLRRNPASARVMQKIGMTYEGCMRQHVLRWGEFENMEIYGLIREGFTANTERYTVAARTQ